MSQSKSSSSSSSSKEKTEYLTIDYTPHYNAIVSSGKSQFSRIADAIAEFIDNSIQATVNNSTSDERNVKISIFVKKPKSIFQGDSYIVILDNGCGMDENGLKEFATYSLDRETRHNNQNNKTEIQIDTSSISKFGVGAKQAGFFLGDSIRVFTKESKNEKILELLIDVKDFEVRYQRNEKVFVDQVKIRDVSTILDSISDETLFLPENPPPGLFEVLSEHIVENHQFTAAVIKINKETYSRFRPNEYKGSDVIVAKVRELILELAEIYHFHLHPEHKPNQLMNNKKFQPEGPDRIRNFPYPCITDNKFRSTITNLARADLNILLQLKEENISLVDQVNLKNFDDSVHKCVERSSAMFNFSMDIPDPFPTSDLDSPVELTQLKGELTASAVNTRRVDGMIFYFPYQGGSETRPLSTTSFDVASHYSHLSTVARMDASSMNSELNENEGNENITSLQYNYDPTFTIYWQDRLVPESFITKLTFFPDAVTKKQCSDKGLPEKWRWRVKGFLFFDWHFKHISNNKLKLQVPHLNDWINCKETEKYLLYRPKNVSSLFHRFLQLSYSNFDREFIFDTRNTKLETQMNAVALENNSAIHSYFEVLTVGVNKFSLRKGDIVKLPKSRGKGKVFGRIVAFRVSELLDEYENRFHGPAEILYIREPVSVFGGNYSNHHPAVASIEFGPNNEHKVTIKELTEIEQHAPHNVKVHLFDHDNSSEPIQGASIVSGIHYYKIGVQILNKTGECILNVPDSSSQYLVQTKLIDPISKRVTDFGTCKDLFIYNPKTLRDEKVTNFKSTSIKKMWYSFGNYGKSEQDEGRHPLIFNSVGSFSLNIEVIDNSSNKMQSSDGTISRSEDAFAVISKSIDITVNAVLISDFNFEFNHPDSENLSKEEISTFIENIESKPRPLGSYLPPFTITLIDCHNNVVENFSGIIEVQLSSNNKSLHVHLEGINRPRFQMIPEEDRGAVSFNNQWIVEPRRGADNVPQFFSPKDKIGKMKDVTFSVIVKTSSSQYATEDEGEELGKPKTFKLRLRPGRPKQIILQEPSADALPLSLHNGDRIPLISLYLIDAWGNRTAPDTGISWLVKLDKSSGPIMFGGDLNVLTSGEAILIDAVVQSDEVIPLSGLSAEQRFYFEERCSTSYEPNEEIFHFPENDDVPEVLMPIKILPRDVPTSVEVYYDGSPIPQPLRVEVGTMVSGLSFRVFSETGTYLEFQQDWFQGKNNGLQVSWNESIRRKRVKPRTTELPDLEVPKVASQTLDYEVQLYFADRLLAQSFQITPTAGVACRLKLLTKENTLSIGNGNLGEFMDIVVGVVLLDRYDNVVKPSTHPKVPVLSLTWTEPNVYNYENNSHKTSLPKPNKRKRGSSNIAKDGSLEEVDNLVDDVSTSIKKIKASSNNDSQIINTPTKSFSNLTNLLEVNENCANKDKMESDDLIEVGEYVRIQLIEQEDMYVLDVDNLTNDIVTCAQVPAVFWLVVSDSDEESRTFSAADSTLSNVERLNMCVQQFTILAGAPYRMHVSCESLNIPSPLYPKTDLSVPIITVNRFTEVSNMLIYLLDRSGFEASTKYLKVGYLDVKIVTTVDDPDISPLYRIKSKSKLKSRSNNQALMNSKHDNNLDNHQSVEVLICSHVKFTAAPLKVPKLKFSEILDKIFPKVVGDSNSVPKLSIVCSCSYIETSDCEKFIESAAVMCKVERLNIVNAVEIDLTRPRNRSLLHMDESEDNLVDNAVSGDKLVVPCDEIFPDVSIRVSTDDNVEYKPNVDDIIFHITVDTLPTGWLYYSSATTKAKSKKSSKGIDVSSRFSVVSCDELLMLKLSNVEENVVSFSGPSRSSNLPLGIYSLAVTYHETRVNFSSLPAPLKEVNSKLVKFVLCSGKPVKILPDNESRLKLYSSSLSNVTNRPNDCGSLGSIPLVSRRNRIIALNVTMRLYDQFDNICISGFDEPNIRVRCHIVCESLLKVSASSIALTPNESTTILPKLSGSDYNGYVFASLLPVATSDNNFSAGTGISCYNNFVFVDIEIDKDSEYPEGVYDLKFEVVRAIDPSPFSPSKDTQFEIMQEYEPFISQISIVNDELRVQKATELSSKQLQLKAIVHQFQQHKNELIDEIISITQRIHNLLQQASRNNLSQYLDVLSRQVDPKTGVLMKQDDQSQYQTQTSVVFTPRNASIADDKEIYSDLKRHLSTLNDQKRRMDFIQQSIRPMKTKNTINLRLNHNIIGFPIELAYVDDYTEAKVLGWAMGSFNDAIICLDSATAAELYKNNQKCLAMDQMTTFKIQIPGNKSRQRTPAEYENKELPLPSLHRIPGNPKYLVNVIQLDNEKESYRDSIFYHIFRRSLLFEDVVSALEYRKSLIDQGIQPPNIYTLSGDRILNDGILNPNKEGRLPDESRLSHVFGQQPQNTNLIYKNLKNDIEVAGMLLECLQLRLNKSSELKSYEEDEGDRMNIENIIQQISDIDDALQEFN